MCTLLELAVEGIGSAVRMLVCFPRFPVVLMSGARTPDGRGRRCGLPTMLIWRWVTAAERWNPLREFVRPGPQTLSGTEVAAAKVADAEEEP
jgi:hypothetical protein